MGETVTFTCPQCGAEVTVGAVQGDRCGGCGFEFKWFGQGEKQTAEDYFVVLTGQKHLLPLPDDTGWMVAHE